MGSYPAMTRWIVAGWTLKVLATALIDFLRIPMQAGHVFRFDPGHPTDLMAATIPI